MNINHKLIVNMDELNETEFPLDKLFSLKVNSNDVKYEFLIRFSSSNKNLICFGSGAYDPKKLSPPIYNRHSWQKEFKESVIYYNDPTLYNSSNRPLKYNSPRLPLGWGIGKHEDWYLSTIANIIVILASKNKIKPENILFFGSSGGGFTSVILSTLIKNSSAIVNNPQMFCWALPDHFDNIINVCFDNLDINFVLNKYKYRFSVIELFKRENYVPLIKYLININSKVDLVDQFIPFINELASFEKLDNDLIILAYSSENGHNGVLSPEDTIAMIKEHFNSKNVSIKNNEFTSNNYNLTNEYQAYLSDKKAYEKKINKFRINLNEK